MAFKLISEKMKFVKVTLLAIVFVLTLVSAQDPTAKFSEMNNYMNKGFSFLASQDSIMENPSSALSKYNIFNYKIDFSKLNATQPSFVIYEKANSSKSRQARIQDFTVEEVQKFNDMIFKGQKVLTNNFLVERSNLIGRSEKLNTFVYFNKVPSFSITLNEKQGFPIFNQQFLKQAIICFYNNTNGIELKDLQGQERFIRYGIKFFSKYGTHYLTKLVFGSKFGLVSDMVEAELKKKGSKQEESLDTNKNETSELDKAVNNINKYKFSNDKIVVLGRCKLDEKKKSISDCDQSMENQNLISYHTKPIFELFNKNIHTNNVKLGESEVSITQFNIMKTNAQLLLTALESSLRADAPVIHKIDVFNNVKKEYENKLSCLKILKNKHFNTYNGNPKSFLSLDNVVDTKVPVFNLDTVNKVVPDLPVAEDKNGQKTYICARRSHALTLESIYSGSVFSQSFIKDAKISNKKVEGKDWRCQQFWVAAPGTTDNDKALQYLCTQKTNNFLDKDLIIDIKFKRFNDDCESFSANGRNYACNCDQDIGDIVPDSKVKKIFLCMAKRSSNNN